MAIEIREATDEETRQRIFRFRYGIHVLELGKDGPGVDHGQRTVRDEADDDATLFYAEEEGRIVGTGRQNLGRRGPFPEIYFDWYDLGPALSAFGLDRVSVTSRLMVDPAYRGRTLASLLVMRLYEHACRNGADIDFCLSEPGLLRLYYRLGYRQYRTAVRPMGPGIRVPLVHCVRDLGHLSRVESPFARALPASMDDGGRAAGLLARTYPGFSAEGPGLEGDLRTVWARLADGLSRRAGRRSLLDGLTEEQVSSVLAKAAPVSFRAGEIIRHRQESRPDLGVVLSGRLGVGLPTHDGWHWLEILGPGEVFGETEVPPPEGRATDLVALEPTQTVLLSENLIAKAARQDPELAIRLTSNLVAGLRQRVDDLHRRAAALAAQERNRLIREQTIPPLEELAR
jgi:CRP-like cAMP-binding protein/GNAT superfamily N-acetyltransferase